MSKSLLFIGGSVDTVPALGHALSLGYNVYVTDGSPESPGIKWAKRYGAGWGIADTYSTIETLEAARDWPIDGVIAVACDVGPIVSDVANALGLPHIPRAISDYGWYKDDLKLRLTKKDKINIPVASPATRDDKYTIIKPIGGRGARGVYRIPYPEDKETFDRYCTKALIAAGHQTGTPPLGKILFEQWVEGPQISTETLISNYLCVFTGMIDRTYALLTTLSPYVIETGGQGPSVYEETELGDRIKDLVQKVVDNLGIQSGTIKCDVVLNEEKNYEPTLIECAIGRMSGGLMCSHIIPLIYGMDFLAGAFSIACGEAPDLTVTGEKRFIHSVFEMPGKAENMTERGKFFLGIGKSREEAREKALEVLVERFTDSSDCSM